MLISTVIFPALRLVNTIFDTRKNEQAIGQSQKSHTKKEALLSHIYKTDSFKSQIVKKCVEIRSSGILVQ
jgi:hypothetical protein